MKKIYDGFENKELSDIWSRDKFLPRAVIMQSDIFRKGKGAVKITINKGDKAQQGGSGKMTERDELCEREDLFSDEGKSYSYSFSLFLPADFPIVSTRLVLAQWKQVNEKDKAIVNNPVIALRYRNGELFITLQTTQNKIKLFQTKEDIKRNWIDFNFKIRFCRKTDGFLKVNMNSKEIIDYKGTTSYNEEHGYPERGKFYFKMGLYRDMMEEPMTAYFDEYKKELFL